MILVTLRHPHSTVKESCVPIGSAGQCATKSVFFNVGLIHDIKSDGITQLIETWVIGIMSCTHSVDVGLLHEEDVLQHAFLRHHTCRPGVVLMAVDSAKTDRTAVDQHLSVFHLHTAETYFTGDTFHDLSYTVLKLEVQSI